MMRVNYTRAEAVNTTKFTAPAVITVNGSIASSSSQSTMSFTSGQWFDIRTIGNGPNSYVANPKLWYGGTNIWNDTPAGFEFVSDIASWTGFDGSYAAYEGTIEVLGATARLTSRCISPAGAYAYTWYCPEKEQDGVIQEPDNDEIWMDAQGVIHFALFTKNVQNNQGRIDVFGIELDLPTPCPSSSASSRTSAASAVSAVSVSTSSRSSSRISSASASVQSSAGTSTSFVASHSSSRTSVTSVTSQSSSRMSTTLSSARSSGGASAATSVPTSIASVAASLSRSSRPACTANYDCASGLCQNGVCIPRSAISSAPGASCSGYECQLGGDSVCQSQGKTCSPAPYPGCFYCMTVLAASSVMSERTVSSAPVVTLPPVLVVSPASAGAQASQVGAKASSAAIGHLAPIETLPEQIIELPFTNTQTASSMGAVTQAGASSASTAQTVVQIINGVPVIVTVGQSAADTGYDVRAGGIVAASVFGTAQSTPLTDSGPAALAVMISGAAAGYAWMRRKR